MQFKREIGFVIASMAIGLILHLFPYDEVKVALYRFEDQLVREATLSDTIANHCSILEGEKSNRASQLFIKLFQVPTDSIDTTQTCRVVVETTHSQRFYIKNLWHFSLLIQSAEGTPVLNQDFKVEFPRALCLLPLAIFLLSLIFEFKPWGLAWTLGTYLFLLGGGNIIHTIEFAFASTSRTFTADQTFIGLLLIILWLSLYRSRGERRPPTNRTTSFAENFFNRFFSLLVGLWNPAAFTLAGKLFLPFRGALNRIVHFLDAQLFIFCVSLYLLSFDFNNLGGFLTESLFLPRYFSFAVLLFLTLTYWSSPKKQKNIIWHQPRFWLGIAFIATMELLSLKISILRELSTVTRVGISLVLSELIWIKGISARLALKNFAPPAGMLFIASFIALASLNSGITDLVLIACEPRIHPTAVALFTFIAGVGLGFLTGSFSTTFFTLYSLLLKSYDLPLVKAALIDGILAGSLLSPFSVFNLFIVAQFGIKLQDLIRFRFRQLFIPLIIAVIIYAVCAINSIAILQPVTFVFLCLVALAFKLKKSSWQLGKNKPLQDPHNAQNSPV